MALKKFEDGFLNHQWIQNNMDLEERIVFKYLIVLVDRPN